MADREGAVRGPGRGQRIPSPAKSGRAFADNPQGVFDLPAAFGGDAGPGGTRLLYTKTVEGDCWISDPEDPAYNRWVTRESCGERNEDLFAKSRPDELFHSALILGFNIEPRVLHQGSAIFFHLPQRDANGDVIATTGGVGLGEGRLRSIIAAIDPAKNPMAILGPKTWFTPLTE